MAMIDVIQEYQDAERRRSVTLGETIQLEEMQEEWQALYQGDDAGFGRQALWTYEQVCQKPEAFFEAVRQYRVIPRYRYVVNYLLICCKIPLSRKNREALFAWIEAASPETMQPMEEDRAQVFWNSLERAPEDGMAKLTAEDMPLILSMLSGIVKRRFLENGFQLPKSAKSWQDYFYQLLKNFRLEYLWDMALGLHMNIQDLNVFLRKVLKRAQLDFYKKEEVFLYITLRWGGSRPYFQCFGRLCQLYGQPMEISPQENPAAEPMPPAAAAMHTRTIGMVLDTNIEKILESLQDKEALFEKIQPRLEAYFSWTEGLLKAGKVRTAQARFQSLWETLPKNLSGEFRAFLTDCKYQSLLQRYENQHRKTLTVHYSTDTEAELPAGHRLSCPVKIGSETETAWFHVEEPVRLPRVTYETVTVKVKALSPGKNLQKLCRLKGWKTAPKFVQEKHITDGIKPEDKQMEEKLPVVLLGEKVRFTSEGEKGQATFQVQCKCGTFIPAGTRFSFTEEGIPFVYEAVEDANTVHVKLTLEPLTEFPASSGAGKKRKPGDKVKAGQKLILDPETARKVQGLLNVTSGKSEALFYFGNGKRTCQAEAECCRSCHIPQGTKLVLQEGTEQFVYRVAEALTLQPFAEARLEVIWDNHQELLEKKIAVGKKNIQKQAEEGEELIPSGSLMDTEHPDILRVFTEKPMKAYPWLPGSELEKIAGTLKSSSGISGKALIEYLYEGPADSTQYYQGVKSYGEDFLLNTRMFRETRLTNNLLFHFPSDDERRRNLILTLYFLSFVSETQDAEEYMTGAGKLSADGLSLYLNDFIYGADKEMQQCGLQAFSGGNPYDAFLFMLLFCDEPLTLFQAIWSPKHPLATYISFKWADMPEDVQVELTLTDSRHQVVSSWNVTEPLFIQSVPRLKQGQTYRLNTVCRQRSGKKKTLKTLWQQEEAFLRTDTGEIDIIMEKEKLKWQLV